MPYSHRHRIDISIDIMAESDYIGRLCASTHFIEFGK